MPAARDEAGERAGFGEYPVGVDRLRIELLGEADDVLLGDGEVAVFVDRFSGVANAARSGPPWCAPVVRQGDAGQGLVGDDRDDGAVDAQVEVSVIEQRILLRRAGRGFAGLDRGYLQTRRAGFRSRR
jgi:hypothetical protein